MAVGLALHVIAATIIIFLGDELVSTSQPNKGDHPPDGPKDQGEVPAWACQPGFDAPEGLSPLRDLSDGL